MDDDYNYPTLRKDVYIGGIGQVTTLSGRSLSGGPDRSQGFPDRSLIP